MLRPGERHPGDRGTAPQPERISDDAAEKYSMDRGVRVCRALEPGDRMSAAAGPRVARRV